MSVVIRAAVALQPGCRLYYDCPLGGADYESREFFDKHRGKIATFVGYNEKLVGVLDHKGRLPGRYVETSDIRVQFDDEEPRSLNADHFVILDPAKATMAESATENQRIGDLIHPILFYSGDMVRVKKQLNLFSAEVHEIGGVFLGEPFTKGGVPRYDVLESEEDAKERKRKFDAETEGMDLLQKVTIGFGVSDRQGKNMAGEDLELVSRGNVWALYHDPSKLTFKSDEDENAFWSTYGICQFVSDEDSSRLLGLPRRAFDWYHLTLEQAYRLCKQEDADVIVPEVHTNRGQPVRYQAMKLYWPFVEHIQRVARLTDRLWAEKAKQTVSARPRYASTPID